MEGINSICIISDDYPSKGRMVFVFVQQLVEAMVGKGINVNVIAPQSIVRSLLRGVKILPQKEKYICEGGEYYVYRPYSLSFGNNRRFLYKLARGFNQSQVEKTLKIINPSIVYGHFWHNALRAEQYIIKYNKKLFVACGEGDDALEDLVASMTPDRIAQVAKMVTGVISVSKDNKRKCLDYSLCTESNIIVLPNCVNTLVFHPINVDTFKEKLGASKTDFVISYTGAFIERKGYNRLSKAINKIGDKRIKVIFSGSPMPGKNDYPECQGIIHCGPVNHNDLPKYLCSSDVFVLPTLKEGCCNAIVEALACGIPVISSRRPFNEDILDDKNSILINPEDVDEIAYAIKDLMTDKTKYQSLKSSVMTRCNEYSISLRADRILDFMKSLI